MIEETIERLKALQDILSQKFTIEQEIGDLPKALSTKTELVNRLKKTYIEDNQQYEDTKKRISDWHLQMKEAEHDREQYEKQMDLVKTQREYEALDREIREASEREQQFRKELQREEKALEEMVEALEREEGMISEQEKELEEEQEKIKTETKARDDRLKQLAKEEKGLIPGLDEELLFKFERIIRSKEGEGIVPLLKSVCAGCQMILPVQFVNDVREGEKILFCPYCSRIVFYVGDEEEADGSFLEEDAEALSDLVNDDEFDFDDEDESVVDSPLSSEDGDGTDGSAGSDDNGAGEGSGDDTGGDDNSDDETIEDDLDSEITHDDDADEDEEDLADDDEEVDEDDDDDDDDDEDEEDDD